MRVTVIISWINTTTMILKIINEELAVISLIGFFDWLFSLWWMLKVYRRLHHPLIRLVESIMKRAMEINRTFFFTDNILIDSYTCINKHDIMNLIILPCFEYNLRLFHIDLDKHDYIFLFVIQGVVLRVLVLVHNTLQ
jgi:hypothetical protein